MFALTAKAALGLATSDSSDVKILKIGPYSTGASATALLYQVSVIAGEGNTYSSPASAYEATTAVLQSNIMTGTFTNLLKSCANYYNCPDLMTASIIETVYAASPYSLVYVSTLAPSYAPTVKPTVQPTVQPTVKPTAKPSSHPSLQPTSATDTGSNQAKGSRP